MTNREKLDIAIKKCFELLEELKETSKKRVFSKVDINKSDVKRTRIMINQYLKGVEELMEKEKVLEIEFVKVWDNWAWRIVKNEIPFSDKSKEIEFNNIKMKKDRTETIFIYDCAFDKFENIEDYILIDAQEKSDLENFIDYVNKNYRKRWRADYNKMFYFIESYGEANCINDIRAESDTSKYKLGNYFKTEEEAQKIINSKEWQEFWAKVRAGEIGGRK